MFSNITSKLTQPYTIIGDCLLINGDCLDVLPLIGKVDAVVTSPPYDNLREYGGYTVDCLSVITQISHGLNEGGVCVWNVSDAVIDGSETGSSFRQALHAISCGLKLHDTMIYAKTSCNFPDASRYQNAFEYVFIFSNGKPKIFNPIKDKPNRWVNTFVHGTSRKKDGTTVARSSSKEIPKFGNRLNWWIINHEQDCTEHPATMPYALAHDHIKSWTNTKQTILDPFMGSGTTGVACAKMGRKFIGIELDAEYYEIGIKRITEAYRQPDLFVEPAPAHNDAVQEEML